MHLPGFFGEIDKLEEAGVKARRRRLAPSGRQGTAVHMSPAMPFGAFCSVFLAPFRLPPPLCFPSVLLRDRVM